MSTTSLKSFSRVFGESLSSRWTAILAAAGLALLAPARVQAQATVTTLGGGSVSPPYSGFVNGTTLTTAKFSMPSGLALDAAGTTLYVADYTNNAIRVVSSAGNTAGSSTSTWVTNGVSRPIAVLVKGSDVYVLNHGSGANGAILHFTGAGGTAVAQPTLASGLVNATAMTMDGANNLYVTVNGNKVIRVTPTGSVTNIGTISGASLQGIVMLDTGKLALTDAGNNGIWIMNPADGTSSALTGFHGASDALGAPSAAAFRTPETIAEAGNGILVVADRGNNKVKLVDTAGNVSLLYGVTSNLWLTGSGKYPGWADGVAGTVKGDAESRQPYGIAVAPDGSVFVDEVFYHVLRHITGTGLTAPPPPGTPGGGSIPSSSSFGGPAGLAYDSADNFLFIANDTNNAVQILDLSATTNALSTFVTSVDGLTNPVSVLLDTADNVYVLNQGRNPTNGYILEFDLYGNSYGPIVTGLNQPTAFTIDGLGNLFVTEQSSNIFAFGSGVSNTIVSITNASASLQGIALFDDGTLAVSDAGNQVIWAVNPITKLISKLTGQLNASGLAVGTSNFAKLNQPRQLTRVAGNQLVGADYGNNRLVLISRAGTVTTNHFLPSAGTIWFGNNATDPILNTNSRFVAMVHPFGVAVDASGNVYDSETFYGDIRKLTGTTLAGPGANPGVPLPVYSFPDGMSLNNESTILFVADPVNNSISQLDLAANQTTLFLDASSGLNHPVDVAVDVNDNVYVLNQGTGGNGSIMEFDKYGNPLGTLVSSLSMPTAMVLNFNTGAFDVAEKNGAVEEFKDTNSTLIATVNVNASVDLEGIAVLDTGSIVVSDAGNDVIWQIAPGSSTPAILTGVLGTPGTTFGAVGFAKLNAPKHLAQASGGSLAIVDSGNNRIVIANDAGTISSALNSTNADLWFGLATDPLTTTSPNFVKMYSPIGLVIAPNGTVYDSESLYKVVRGILATGFVPPLRPAPPAAPRIGWFDYEGNSATGFYSVLHPVTKSVFNNDQLIAVDPMTNGVSTYFIDGSAPLNSAPSATNGSTPPFYQDGLAPFVTPLPVLGVPDLIIDAINIDAIGQMSPVTQAEFIFQAANPTIIGNNGAQFTVTDLTTNSVLYYTLDGSDPTNHPPSTSIGPVALNSTNGANLSLVVDSNILFKVRAFRGGYLPSGIASQYFSPSNFVANIISFGFASGEASSKFVGAAGQTFYAPVTLTILPNVNMYSLQFNVVVTNAGPNPGPAIAPGAFNFQSMLMKPGPLTGEIQPIPPYMYVGDNTGPLNPGQIVPYGGTNFVDLLTVNSSLNLLGVGWLERATETNLYPTTSQDLIQMSMAHDDLFTQAGGKIIVGGYSFQIPPGATSNQTYQIQIGRPSATADGIGAPGSDVYIANPTNGNLGAGSPVNAVKFVTVGQIKYLVGSVYPFGWFNAGDFGSSNIVNADVEQVFQSAIYGLNSPPPGSDFFDAMDSCGSFGAIDGNSADANFGYYTNSNTTLAAPSQTSLLFSGDDTTINQVVFGDGQLDVCDVYVTFRRSLDPSLTWFRRFWNNGQLVADTARNVASHGLKAPAVAQAAPASSASAQVNFSAGDVVGLPGQTVQVPINATILGNYPLRLLMLNLTVEPLDGSPALTLPVSFSQTAAALGSPLTTSSDGTGNYAAVWLNSTNSGLTGTVTLGNLSVTIPATANGSAAYAIHFDHASASPNGLASFPNQKFTGLLTTSARTNSSYADGIPDSWRLRWFGTVNNMLSASNACPSGDGVPNWKKYVAGVDPNVANDFPSVNAKTPVPAGAAAAIHWPSVSGKQYVITESSSLFGMPWTVLSTNTGTGGDMEFDDTNATKVKFYRVEILP